MTGERINALFAALALALLLTFGSASTARAKAGSHFIPAAGRTDMVYNSHSKTLFITSGSSVLRYSLKEKKFLSPINLGGTLIGIDLSPDGKTLAVADETVMSLNIVNLKTLEFTKLPITPGADEVGLFDVAWGSDNMVYATGALPAGWSGWVSLRQVDPVSGNATVLGEIITNYTVLRASADRTVIGFAQADISDGRWGSIDVPTGNVTFRDGYSDGTSWFNYDIAVAGHGSQFALPTYGGLFIYDDTFTKIWTLGQYAVTFFEGVAYSPKDGNLYATEANTDQIDVFSPPDFKQVQTYQVDATFPDNGNGTFSSGILRFSSNGSLLFVSVPGGIQYLKIP